LKPSALYYRILQYQPSNRALLDARFAVTELDDPRQDTDAGLARTEVLFAPLGYQVDEAKMRRAPRLRAVVSNTTGIPHIDAGAAARRGIWVCALHDEPAFLDRITPTAELTVGLMIACMRRIPAAARAAAEGRWDRRPWGAPRMLSRLRLGIVGYGRLGRKVAAAGAAFGMDVAWFDPHVAGGVPSLDALAARSDVLSLHAPANAETAGLVSRAVLERLPPGAVVVNTARGELLDTDALLDLLEAGRLYAAALDTVAGEYDPAQLATFGESRLARYARTHDNLLLTPHIGGSTVDAWSETERFVIEKACRALGLPEGGA
jgi:D-3-phosphoglycerate dehydrogenase